jgi:hypothetical protein
MWPDGITLTENLTTSYPPGGNTVSPKPILFLNSSAVIISELILPNYSMTSLPAYS